MQKMSSILKLIPDIFFFLIGIHSMQAKQPLQGMELQEKETQKD